MKKQNFYFITNKCNASCPYCFVKHGNFVTTKEDIDRIEVPLDGENVIYGGEPTLYPELVDYLIEKLNHRDIVIYSNGSNLEYLKSLKDVRIVINYDAYRYNLQRDVDAIMPFDEWVFTIAPSNLDKVLEVYNDYIDRKHYHYMKIMYYYNEGADYWTPESLKKLDETLKDLYSAYAERLINQNENYMPWILRDTLKRLLAYSSNEVLTADCSTHSNHIIAADSSCVNCTPLNRENKRCYGCAYEKVCQFNIPCLDNVSFDMCSLVDVLNKNALEVFNKLKDNVYFQKTIFSIYEGTFYVKKLK